MVQHTSRCACGQERVMWSVCVLQAGRARGDRSPPSTVGRCPQRCHHQTHRTCRNQRVPLWCRYPLVPPGRACRGTLQSTRRIPGRLLLWKKFPTLDDLASTALIPQVCQSAAVDKGSEHAQPLHIVDHWLHCSCMQRSAPQVLFAQHTRLGRAK